MTAIKKLGLAMASSILLCGCASKEPIRLHELQPAKYDSVGVLWSWSRHVHGLERPNYATVTRIDDVRIDTSAYTGPPIELLPGRHVVEIRYDRDSFLCGYFGCMSFKQSTKSLELLVESGHSYKPFTGKRCNRDWFWIEDLGISALDAISAWKERYRMSPPAFELRTTNRDKSKIVAGEAPPENCEGVQ